MASFRVGLTSLFLAACTSFVTAQVPSREAIDDALDRGGSYLASRFAKAGKKGSRPKEREEPGMQALVLYAMLKAGVAKDDPAVRRLLLSLSTTRIEKTYDATCAILAIAAHRPHEHLATIAELARSLVAWQEEAGDWGYPDGPVIDLSNTQYAALGLWKAASLGLEVSPEVWKRLAEAVYGYQSADGGYSYMAPGMESTGSMTTAGLGTLSICELELRRAGALDDALAQRIKTSLDRGLDWMRDEFRIDDNPKSGAWHYYYLYGLERVGGLRGLTHFGDHDWYAEGARLLIAEQEPEGSWKRGSDLSETCFAILFLERATSSDPPGPRRPVSRDGETPKETEDPEAEVQLGSGRRPDGPPEPTDGSVHVWIKGFRPASTRRLEWPNERGKGPRVARVEYSVAGQIVGVVLGDATRPSDGGAFGARLHVPARGKVEVTARVFVLPPPEVGADAYALTPAKLELEVTDPLPTWCRGFLDDPVSMTPDAKPSAKGSSTAKKAKALPPGDYAAEFAVDGLSASPWLTKPGDDEPWIRGNFRKAEDIERIRLQPARLPGYPAQLVTQPTSIAVSVNGGDEVTLELDPNDSLAPLTLDLEEPTKVKRVEVRLLGVTLGEDVVTGLGEIELLPAASSER